MKRRVGWAAIVATSFLTLALVVSEHAATPPAGSSVTVAAAGVAPQPKGPISRDQALQRARDDKKEIQRLDLIDVKQTTPLEFARAKNSPDALSETDGTTAVWAVAIGGDIVPLFSKGANYTWAVLLFKVDTGEPLGMSAGNSGPWPPFWTSLVDRGR